MPEEPSFTCPRCGAVSHNANDLANGYCGRCHDYTGAIAVRIENTGSVVTMGVGSANIFGRPLRGRQKIVLPEPGGEDE